MKWLDTLRGDSIPWLLEPENPSVRYWTLTDILDRPADDPDVREVKAAIAQQPLVQELFARQHPDGHWAWSRTSARPLAAIRSCASASTKAAASR